MRGHLKFVYEVQNQIALKRTMLSQTKACIAKLSCGDREQSMTKIT